MEAPAKPYPRPALRGGVRGGDGTALSCTKIEPSGLPLSGLLRCPVRFLCAALAAPSVGRFRDAKEPVPQAETAALP